MTTTRPKDDDEDDGDGMLMFESPQRKIALERIRRKMVVMT